ncbi:MAG: NAD(P)/FAD-dependent oxidoreductase [Terriglobales bacterium]
MDYDLAIVGAGPAGCSAAITAAQCGLRVVLCERGGDPAAHPRDKVCGEFISAEAAPLLAEWIPQTWALAPRVLTASITAAAGQSTLFTLPWPGRGLSRLALDRALWCAAGAAGAALRPRTAVACLLPRNGGAEVRLASGGAFTAAAAILATGRRRHAPAGTGWVGLKARFRGLPARSEIELFALPDGYCGLAPVEGGWTNVSCLLRQRRAPSLRRSRDFSAWLASVPGARWVRSRLHGGEQATATVVAPGIVLGAHAPTAGLALTAGDASGFVDPFTGDGIARALLSGRLAAELAASGEAGAYPHELARSSGYLAAALLRPVLSAPPWLQALALGVLANAVVGPRLMALTRWRARSVG